MDLKFFGVRLPRCAGRYMLDYPSVFLGEAFWFLSFCFTLLVRSAGISCLSFLTWAACFWLLAINLILVWLVRLDEEHILLARDAVEVVILDFCSAPRAHTLYCPLHTRLDNLYISRQIP